MKKFIAIFTALTLLLISTTNTTVFASESTSYQNEVDTVSVYMDAKGKTDFSTKMDAIYETSIMEGEIIEPSREDIDFLMEQVTFAKNNEDKEIFKQKLSEYGVYLYPAEEIAQNRSGSGDVTLTAPHIFYQAWENSWTVTCGGNWNTLNWGDNILPGNIGGLDAFGVGYTNSTLPYKSYVMHSTAYLSDGIDSNHNVSTTNRSDGDGSKGFGFRLQDYTYGILIHTYVGLTWYGACTYDNYFSSYNGVATAYYVHTYDTANISSVTFGAQGKTAGVNIEITSKENSFIAYSNDTRFGAL